MEIDLTSALYIDLKKELIEELLKTNNLKSGCLVALENREYDPIKKQQFPNGFLHFQSILEVYPNESGESLESQIVKVSVILKAFWNKNIPAIATSDYEERLPKFGGYKDDTLPWPKTDAFEVV